DAKSLLEAVEKRFRETLDQTFDRLQKLVSQLEILAEKLSQEDINQKLLRSLSPEWNTHVVVSYSSTQNMAFVSSSNNNSGTSNEVVNIAQTINTAYGVFVANTQVNTANSSNVDNLSDVVIYAFLASQLDSPQLVTKDLQ
ncbi:hypothetical protein Tco_1169587, partial [Tanacetum coccineum]